MKRDSAEFISQLTQAQTGLYAFIRTLVPQASAASDVLQNANVTIWQKAETFEPGTNFMAWACRIGYFEVLNLRRKVRRERQVLDQDVLELLAQEEAAESSSSMDKEMALRACMDHLTSGQKKLIEQRYGPDGSVRRVADESGKSVGAISQALFRIREALADCIERRIRLETHS